VEGLLEFFTFLKLIVLIPSMRAIYSFSALAKTSKNLNSMNFVKHYLQKRMLTEWKHHPECPFQLLNSSKQDDIDKIKKQFYILSKQLHPDMNRNKEMTDKERSMQKERFLKLQAAWELIKDQESRDFYLLNRHSTAMPNLHRNRYPNSNNYRQPPRDYKYYDPNYDPHFQPKEMAYQGKVWFFGLSFILMLYYFASVSYYEQKMRHNAIAWLAHKKRSNVKSENE
jgi:curved DNA-binding protein CbpA